MPFPANLVQKRGKFRLSESFTVDVRGKAHPRIYKAAARLLRRLAGRTFFCFPQNYITPDSTVEKPSMVIECQRQGRVVLHEDESYKLKVTTEEVELAAVTDIGALRGLETYLQLLSADEEGYYIPAVQIDDKPRFPWRGLLIDCCRHFMPLEVLRRNMDGMAAVKLNVLHLHLTDDQGIRIECKNSPKLHEMGSDGLYYAHAQIKELIAYADDRGIRIVPEFDMPGHATSWFVGYPELASAPGPYKTGRHWGIFDPTMDPTREETYEFLDAFFREMCALFPDEYVHIGGDEVTGRQWDEDPRIQVFIKKNGIPDNHALQGYFNKRVAKILRKYGKKMVGWSEIFQPRMPKDIVIQAWHTKKAHKDGHKTLIESARKRYQSILSNGYYINVTWPAKRHYTYDPIPETSPLTEDEKQYILGGEACMWSEGVSQETIDSRIWPRTAAIAERLWSPSHIKDIDDMYRRLEATSFRLEDLGLTHEKNYEMMLRRLTNGQDTTALRHLVDVLMPRKHGLGSPGPFHPLTGIADAARPDSRVERTFNKLVTELVEKGDMSVVDEIKKWLDLWSENHGQVLKRIQFCPSLKTIEKVSEDLSLVSKIGLKALDYVRKDKKASPEWIREKIQVLEKARETKGEVRLRIVTSIEILVQKAGGAAA